jgi:hypothetical protein
MTKPESSVSDSADDPIPAGAFERIGSARPYTVVVNVTIVEESPQAAIDAVGLMVQAEKHGARVAVAIVGCQPEWVRPFTIAISGYDDLGGQHYAIGGALRALGEVATSGIYRERAMGEVRDAFGGVVLAYTIKQLRGMHGG